MMEPESAINGQRRSVDGDVKQWVLTSIRSHVVDVDSEHRNFVTVVALVCFFCMVLRSDLLSNGSS